MKPLQILAIIIFLFELISCKKNRVCECKNSIGVYDAGEIEMTKIQAKKYCKSLTVGETVCSLKK